MRNGALEVAGSGWLPFQSALAVATRSAARTTPSAMSSTKVKSRLWCPLLKTSMGLPSRMFLVNRNSAISGRPQGPYTVKKRSPVTGSLNNAAVRRERHVGVEPIHRAGRSEHQVFHAVVAAALEHIERAGHVAVDVG